RIACSEHCAPTMPARRRRSATERARDLRCALAKKASCLRAERSITSNQELRPSARSRHGRSIDRARHRSHTETLLASNEARSAALICPRIASATRSTTRRHLIHDHGLFAPILRSLRLRRIAASAATKAKAKPMMPKPPELLEPFVEHPSLVATLLEY